MSRREKSQSERSQRSEPRGHVDCDMPGPGREGERALEKDLGEIMRGVPSAHLIRINEPHCPDVCVGGYVGV